MNLTRLRKSPGPRRLVYLTLLICAAWIFYVIGGYIADFRNPSFLWPLFFGTLFIVTVTIAFTSFYEMDFAFLLYILGAPTGVAFTQIGLRTTIYTLDTLDWVGVMNDFLMIFCLGSILSGIGFFLGGNERIPHERVSFTSFCLSVGFFIFCLVMAVFLSLPEGGRLIDAIEPQSLAVVVITLLIAFCLSFLRPGDFSKNLSSSVVFTFFIAAGCATLLWYEMFMPSLTGDYTSVGPMLVAAILLIAYSINFYIFYLLFLLHYDKDLSNKFGTTNWHIIEAYLFWFLICFAPAALVDLT
jgi:hypothetical protein